MIVNKDTKISKILKEKPHAIDVIAGINSNFKKLQNPILRRSLATRVSVRDAAQIGKVSINDFLKELEKIGFNVEYVAENEIKEVTKTVLPPDFSNKEIVKLDIRPIINEGKDPFGYIIKIAKTIKPDQILLVINNFEPIPLIDFLTEKNFVHWMTQDEAGNYLAYFKLNCKKKSFLQRLFGKKNMPCQYHDDKKIGSESFSEKTQKTNDKEPENDEQFDKIKNKFDGKMKEIDVRHLDMPMPMQTILENIEQLSDNEALFVHHKRVPQFLIPELRKRNFKYVIKEVDPDYTYLIIYKDIENI